MTIHIDWVWVAIVVLAFYIMNHNYRFYMLGKQSVKIAELIKDLEEYRDTLPVRARG